MYYYINCNLFAIVFYYYTIHSFQNLLLLRLYMVTKYISKIILFVATTFLSINYLLGQNPDSIKTINMEEVMVSANKTEKPFVELTVPAKIISRAEIEKSGHSGKV